MFRWNVFSGQIQFWKLMKFLKQTCQLHSTFISVIVCDQKDDGKNINYVLQ